MVDGGEIPNRCMAQEVMNFSTAVWAPGSVTTVRFKEVAVYFSEEEWSQLDPWQKELYGNVMRDIHAALLSLGYTILHPDVLCRIRCDRGPYVSSQKEDHKGISFPSTDLPGASGLSPDIIFRIKHDEKDGEDVSFKSELEFPSEISDVPINEEEKLVEELKEDMKNLHSNEDFTRETKKDKNVTEIKTEAVFTPDCNKSPPSKNMTKTKNNTPKSHQIPDENSTLHDDGQAGKGEESLLSIVLRRANSGGLQAQSYKQFDICKYVDCSRSVPGIVEKETFYPPKPPILKTPGNNELSSILQVPPAPPPHEIERPFRCCLCGKCFKTLAMLNVHMKTHSGIRPYQCNECGKSFRDNWNLKVHQKIHTGETPYRCSICDKGFVQYATYMKHQRIHTGEKPYSCCYCDKSFTNSSNLVRHYRTHTGEKPYACTECGKGFSHSTSLIQHKRLHKVVPTETGANGPRNMTNRKRY
ncbi:uncharacterized protein [Dendrobates tinctorius]|uniref:uncharacterized protein isoform X2 n=1 Tax=Dendrobates tinctorius TaxID=92724 RepID=UPI003CC98EF6